MTEEASIGRAPQLEASDREDLFGTGRLRRFSPGDRIYGQGERGTEVALVRSGVVKIILANAAGDEAILGLCGPGDVVGEMAANPQGDGRRGASISALGKVTLQVIPNARFEGFLGERPDVFHRLTEVMSYRMKKIADVALSSATIPVRQRVARLLLDLGENYGSPADGGFIISLGISQNDLAQYVGARRESVVRALHDLRGRKLITTARTTITILDAEGLRLV